MQTVTSLALAVSLAFTTGCVRGKARYAAYAGEVVVTSLGLVLATQVDPEDQSPDDHVNTGGLRRAVITTGIVMAALGLVGFGATYMVNDRDDDETPRPPPPELASLEPIPTFAWADPLAVRLTLQARRAAVAGACQAVTQAAPRVHRADAAYYQSVFMLDPAIASCR